MIAKIQNGFLKKPTPEKVMLKPDSEKVMLNLDDVYKDAVTIKVEDTSNIGPVSRNILNIKQ